MLRFVLPLLAGCATGVCDTCPQVSLTANGAADLTVAVGTQVAYTWTSVNADIATSTLAISPGPDACGNTNGPWVISTLAGSTDPLPLLACQAGFAYALEVEVTQQATGASASAMVTITVQ